MVHLGYGLTSKRRTDPALTPAQLPSQNALVLSHLHGPRPRGAPATRRLRADRVDRLPADLFPAPLAG